MVTDPIFYRLFETSPETFFLVLGMTAESGWRGQSCVFLRGHASSTRQYSQQKLAQRRTPNGCPLRPRLENLPGTSAKMPRPHTNWPPPAAAPVWQYQNAI